MVPIFAEIGMGCAEAASVFGGFRDGRSQRIPLGLEENLLWN